MTVKFELSLDFLTMHLPTKFHHSMFNRSEVIMLTDRLTNKKILLKTSTSLCCATLVEKDYISSVAWDGWAPYLCFSPFSV